MIKKYIEKIIEGESLTFEESAIVLNQIMEGGVNHSHISALLTALKMKGEAPSELAGFVKAMKEKSLKLDHNLERVMDVCGTGGDNSGTFNISTAAAFVVAAAGVPVAKHGNSSVSSKCGSADVLKSLGVNIHLPVDASRKALEEIGITFLFAPQYHPAMKYVAPVRKELGFKTIFNILGPLSNPADTKIQLVGTFNEDTAIKMREALNFLSAERFAFVNTLNKYDEVTLTGYTNVFEVINNVYSEYSLSPDDFDYPTYDLGLLRGDTSEGNAKVIIDIFDNSEKTPAYHVVAANAALALYTAGMCTDINECKLIAEEAIDSSKAKMKLTQFIDFGEKY